MAQSVREFTGQRPPPGLARLGARSVGVHWASPRGATLAPIAKQTRLRGAGTKLGSDGARGRARECADGPGRLAGCGPAADSACGPGDGLRHTPSARRGPNRVSCATGGPRHVLLQSLGAACASGLGAGACAQGASSASGRDAGHGLGVGLAGAQSAAAIRPLSFGARAVGQRRTVLAEARARQQRCSRSTRGRLLSGVRRLYLCSRKH